MQMDSRSGTGLRKVGLLQVELLGNHLIGLVSEKVGRRNVLGRLLILKQRTIFHTSGEIKHSVKTRLSIG